NVNGRELSDPAFAPIFARCEGLGLPVLLHPIAVVGAERLRPFYLQNLLGNPFDTAIAAAHLRFGGVLAPRAKPQACRPHMGYARPREIITKHARLSKADQARVLGGNALRLLRLS